MGSKKALSKKKGPKGKKARAKAKLERHWGEVAIIDDENKTKRIGSSRLLAQKKSALRWGDSAPLASEKEDKRNGEASEATSKGRSGIMKKTTKLSPRHNHRRRCNDHGFSSSSDASSDEDSDGETMAIDALMLKIKKLAKKKKKAAKRAMKEGAMEEEENEEEEEIDAPMEKDEASSDDEESARSSESEDEIDDDSMSISNDDVVEDDDASIEDDENEEESTVDIFRTRFSHPPLTDAEMGTMIQPAATKQHVPIGDSAELHVTRTSIRDELKDFDVAEKDRSKSDKDEHWQKCAKKTLESSRKVLNQRWAKFNKKKDFTSLQAPLYTAISTYADVFAITNSMKERRELQRLQLLHVLNHVLTSRSRIQRHNRELRDIEKRSEGENKEMGDVDEEKFRDQGFTRPTVLVILPTRSTCHSFVRALFRLTGNDLDNGMNERFQGEFGNADDDEESSDDDRAGSAAARRKRVMKRKGKDWNELFGEGVNQDDDFKIGISLTPKSAKSQKQAPQRKEKKSSNVGIKTYSDFYKSDIILASPLGLKLLIAPEDDEGKGGDYDYLSSIEICVVQYSDVLMMQNWDHVNDILSSLNREPQNNNNTDFSRVRNYLLEGQGAHWRQLLFSSNVMDPFLQSSFKRFGRSISGSIKMRRKVQPEDAAISDVLIPMKQVFQVVPAPSFGQQSSSRVGHFVRAILPEILRSDQKHTMIYIPSYFDFCSLRNVFLKRELTFVSIHEYSRTSEVGRGRARFQQGRKPIMLYTGRCNFFHRHDIKGVRHLIFLGLPEHPEFYSHHVNQIASTENDPSGADGTASSVSSCLVLCTKYEAIALERIVGSANCSRMLKSQKSTFMFYS